MAQIKRTIQQRKAAEAAHELAVTLEHEHEWRGDAKRFWEEVIRLAMLKLPMFEEKEEKKPEKMTDREARDFGQNETMPFGEFAGMQVDAVPVDRLRWYADQFFVDDLRRYLESDRVKNESNS
jgi:hypothetical protein